MLRLGLFPHNFGKTKNTLFSRSWRYRTVYTTRVVQHHYKKDNCAGSRLMLMQEESKKSMKPQRIYCLYWSWPITHSSEQEITPWQALASRKHILHMTPTNAWVTQQYPELYLVYDMAWTIKCSSCKKSSPGKRFDNTTLVQSTHQAVILNEYNEFESCYDPKEEFTWHVRKKEKNHVTQYHTTPCKQ